MIRPCGTTLQAAINRPTSQTPPAARAWRTSPCAPSIQTLAAGDPQFVRGRSIHLHAIAQRRPFGWQARLADSALR